MRNYTQAKVQNREIRQLVVAAMLLRKLLEWDPMRDSCEGQRSSENFKDNILQVGKQPIPILRKQEV